MVTFTIHPPPSTLWWSRKPLDPASVPGAAGGNRGRAAHPALRRKAKPARPLPRRRVPSVPPGRTPKIARRTRQRLAKNESRLAEETRAPISCRPCPASCDGTSCSILALYLLYTCSTVALPLLHLTSSGARCGMPFARTALYGEIRSASLGRARVTNGPSTRSQSGAVLPPVHAQRLRSECC